MDLVPERPPVLAVVAQYDRGGALCGDRLAQPADRCGVGVRALQEAAIAPEHLVRAVAGHVEERLVGVDDRVVVLARIGEHHARARVIQRAKQEVLVHYFELQAVRDLGELEHAQRLAVSREDDQRAALLAGAHIGVQHDLQAGRIEEADLAQIEDHARRLVSFRTPQFLLQTRPGLHVELAAHGDVRGLIGNLALYCELKHGLRWIRRVTGFRPMFYTESLPKSPTSASAARRMLDRLADELDADTLDQARLLLSELVTNAFEHVLEAGDIEVRVRCEDGLLRVEVLDSGPGFTPRPRAQGAAKDSGWGLHFTELLAERWAADRDERSRVSGSS